jgi:DnaJ-class molecular chaperone
MIAESKEELVEQIEALREALGVPCDSCEGTGTEWSGVEHMGAREVVGCQDCRALGVVPKYEAEVHKLRAEVERFGVKFYPSDRNANEIAEALTKPCPRCGGDGSGHDGDRITPDGPCVECEAWGRVEA